MKLIHEDTRALMEPREELDASKLLNWLRGDIQSAITLGVYNALEKCAETRASWRARKYRDAEFGENPFGISQTFPWPGAIQSESRMVDERCNEEAHEFLALWVLAKKKFSPRQVMDEGERAKRSLACQKAGEYFLDLTDMEMLEAMALGGQSLAEFGATVFYEGWETKWRRARKHFTLDEMMQKMVAIALQQAGIQEGQEQGDGEEGQQQAQQEQMVVQMVNDTVQQMIATPELIDQLITHIQAVDPLMPTQEARRIAVQLQKGTQEVDYFAPEPDHDKPVHEALVPFVDAVWPASITSFRKLPRITRFIWMTEAEIRVKAFQEGWDEDWTNAVLKNPGMCVDITSMGISQIWALNGTDMGMQNLQPEAFRMSGMYQIAEMWWLGVDKMGLETPYRTLIHSCYTEKVGLNEPDPLGHGRLPFIGVQRTHLRKLVGLSRGVGDEIYTHQLIEERGMDGLVAQGELRNIPPRLVTTEGGADGLRPGADVAVTNRYASGNGFPRFMEVPDISNGSLEVLKLNRISSNRFYKRGEQAQEDQQNAKNRQSAIMGQHASVFKRILELMFLNIQHQVDMLDIGSIAGVPIDLRVTNEDLQGAMDISAKCSMEQMDLELATEKMKAFTSFAAAADRNGQCNWSRVFQIFSEWIDIDLAQTAIVGLDTATDKARSDENNRITQIMARIPLDYPEGRRPDAVPVRQQALQVWTQNPTVQQILQSDKEIADAFEKERQWLWFDTQQYVTNAAIGRTGVAQEAEPKPTEANP